ncbi:MAG: hypothetical protein WBW47_07550 [Thermoplasmata archaeon]
MQASIQSQTRESQTPTEPTATVSRLRTVTGNRFPRKCACGCGFQIPRDPEVRYVVDFGAPRPYPAFLREHSPDYGTYHGKPRAREDAEPLPGFVRASDLPRPTAPKPPIAPRPMIEVAHEEAETSASPEAGRPWASGQLVFNAGQFESARSGFADYAKDGETGEQLRARVNRIILEDLEQKVLALRALHAKLRDMGAGVSFGEVVARSRPTALPPEGGI